MIPYEENKKHIFISYAHLDSQKVLPILNKMQLLGFRLWYDAAIQLGEEWPAYIESNLKSCDVVISFMTPNAVESKNCRREINLALKEHKKLLVIYLEPTELLYGLDLQLNTEQSLLKYNLQTEDDFYDRLIAANILRECIVPTTPKTPAQNHMNTSTKSRKMAQKPESMSLQLRKKAKAKTLVIMSTTLAILCCIALIAIHISHITSPDATTPSSDDNKPDIKTMDDQFALGHLLPDFGIPVSKVTSNNNTTLEFTYQFNDFDRLVFDSYVEKCKDLGFHIESDYDEYIFDERYMYIQFSAHNSSGYFLHMMFIKEGNKNSLEICLEDPVKRISLPWSYGGFMENVPVPKSLTGEIDTISNDCFSILLVDMDESAYHAYIYQCKANGFNGVFTDSNLHFFEAQNTAGVHLQVIYRGFNTISLSVFNDN